MTIKKFYILFLTVPLLFVTVLYLSVWWSVALVVLILAFIAYRFYAEQLEAALEKTKTLESDIEELNVQLEKAVLKEQKTSKEAAQVKHSKQQLLSALSHEIRTPLNGVMGMTLLLSDTALNKEQQEYINTIHRCSEGLLTTVNAILVNDLLDFSKLQQEGGQLEYKAFELRDCVEEVLELFADKAAKKNIDILYDIDEAVPLQLIGDSKRLKQVLINLVENAVRHTTQGEVVIRMQSAPGDHPGNPPYLVTEVKDTGSGIAEEKMKNLFKGIQGKASRSSEGPEPGLGLVVCKKLVELMGGSIDAVSKAGYGSTFIFRIPLTPSMKPAYYQSHEDELPAGKHILIVDSNTTRRDWLAKQLKAWKMLPMIAEDHAQAMTILLKQKDIDLALINLNITTANGVQFATSLRKEFPKMPIIGLNNPGDTSYEQWPPVFASIITKPVRYHVLRDKIAAVFAPPAVLNENSMSDIFAMQYPLRLLVAEDNAVNQKIAIMILEKLGYQPALANNGKEVMELVAQDTYDIILMDVQMPEMNGLEATRMIRTCLDVQPVIIALTANAMQGDRDECMQAGMDDYLSKPIELNELVTKLEKWALSLRNRKKLSA